MVQWTWIGYGILRLLLRLYHQNAIPPMVFIFFLCSQSLFTAAIILKIYCKWMVYILQKLDALLLFFSFSVVFSQGAVSCCHSQKCLRRVFSHTGYFLHNRAFKIIGELMQGFNLSHRTPLDCIILPRQKQSSCKNVRKTLFAVE